MDNEQRFWIAVWPAVLFPIALSIWIICHYSWLHSDAYIKAGYTKTTLPGSSTAHWVLPQKEKK